MHRKIVALLAGALLACGPAAPSVRAAEPTRVIIVFDASGSMAGQVPGGAKIDVAKRTVSEIVSGMDPSVELGLIAYGHRKKGDCKDIELLVPPAPQSGAAILSAVERLQPVGKTPLSDAVVQAAQYLKFTENKASVILISDGVETCGSDPCAIGRQLEAQGIDFTCHVVGFDLKPGESSELECLAKQTGGLYFVAKDAKSLMEALKKAIQQVIMPSTVLVVEPRTSSGGEIVGNVSFELISGGQVVSQGEGGRWTVELPQPGAYRVQAVRDGKKADLEVSLKAGETLTREVVFAETGLKVAAYDKKGGVAYLSDVSWALFGPPNSEGKRPQMAFSYESQPFLKVPAGKYLLRAERGSAYAEQEVEVGEGAPVEFQLVLGSGALKLAAVTKKGEAPIGRDLAWEILGAPDAEGDRPQIAISYEAQPSLTVPGGKWLVAVTHGSASGRMEVEVRPGEDQEVVLSLESGQLKAEAYLEEGSPPIGKDLAWEVLSEPNAEGDRKQIAFSYEAAPTFSLPSGHFLLTVVHGSAKASREITVVAGESEQLALSLGAGKLRIGALPAPGTEPVSKDLAWEVKGEPNAEGERAQVAYSYEASPTFSLPAGRYLVEAAWGASKAGREFTITSGKLVEEDLILDAGSVAAKAIMGEGADPAPKDLAWLVFAEPDAEGNRKDVAFSYESEPIFRLNAGHYLLQVTRGGAVAKAEIEVQAGRQVPATLNLNAGVVKVKTQSSNFMVEVQIFSENDEPPANVGYSYEKESTFYVPAGKARVIIQDNADSARKSVQDIDIRANKLQEISIGLP